MKYYFTFGVGHKNEGYCQPIHARNAEEARKKMIEFYGPKWSFQYTENEWMRAKKEGLATEKLLIEIH